MRTLLRFGFIPAHVVIFSLVAAMAQAPPAPAPSPGPGPTPGTTPGPGPGPTRGEPSPAPGRDRGPTFEQPGQRQQQRGMDEMRPIFLSGKVVLDDGTPPPEPVVIEIVCSGQSRPQAYTDSKGRFSFQLGQRSGMIMDASTSTSGGLIPGVDSMNTPGVGMMGAGTSGGLGSVQLMGCGLRAVLPGYRSEEMQLNRRSIFDNPDVGTIILKRLGNVPGAAISFTTLAAPKDAKKAYEKAQKLVQSKPPKHADAAKELEKAVQEYPKFAAAWNMLGEAKLALKDEEGARKAFEQSMTADTKYLNPYLHLAVLELRASHWDAAANVTNQLTQLNPMMGQAHFYNAVANFNLGKMELAEKAARNAVKNDEAGRMPQTRHLLGSILARKGNFPSAAEEYRSFLKMAPNASGTEQVRKQLAEWETLGVIEKEVAPAVPAADKEQANKEKR